MLPRRLGVRAIWSGPGSRPCKAQAANNIQGLANCRRNRSSLEALTFGGIAGR